MSARIIGLGTKSRFLEAYDGPTFSVESDGVPTLDIRPADQTVTVDAGFRVLELQEALRSKGQALPLPSDEWGPMLQGFPGTVGGLIGTNLPHALFAPCGGIKDWLLQAEVVFQGQVAKSGAKVVKNVAGYDAHKLYVGARGTLGPVVRATLRTWPLRAVPPVQSVILTDSVPNDVWIVRTLPSLFRGMLSETSGVLAYDPPSCTLWTAEDPSRPREGWMVGPGGARWPEPSEPTLLARIKAAFDPEGQWH